MSYSSLATTVIWSPFNSGTRNHTIDSVAIHTMGGDMDVEACGQLFQKSGWDASSNYGVDKFGNIGVYVDESDRSWCTSSGGVDHRAVTIEVAATSESEPYACTDAAYESLIKLLVDICNRNKIKGLYWKADKEYAISAANGGPVTDQNMFVHRWFARDGKTCPGEYLYSKHYDIANEVNTRLKNGVTYQGPNSTSSSSSQQTITINYEEFDPYVITVTRNSKKIPYDKLLDNRIIGAIVEAGYLFTPQHQQVTTFESPELRDQIKNFQEIEMSYGLMLYARAKTTLEAKQEMYQLSFPLQRYRPELGVWLQLELGKNKDVNSTILDRYVQDLRRLGYSNKCGIICDRKTLDTIDWETYQNNFFLNIVDHIEKTSELDKLMDPEFFDVDMSSSKDNNKEKDTNDKKTTVKKRVT